jgi:hypothetical protein
MAFTMGERISSLANNQLVIKRGKKEIFQSYGTIIAVVENNKITLDRKKWDFSRTTTKYLGRFLGCNKADIEKRIKDGTYKLANLN